MAHSANESDFTGFHVWAVPIAQAQTALRKAQSGAQSLCFQCLNATRDELKKCLDAAISQEDKKSCLEKQEARAKTCDNGECNLERVQSGTKGDIPAPIYIPVPVEND